MSKHDPRATLKQIAESVGRARLMCADKMLEALCADWQATLALERALEIVGEAVKRLPMELRDCYPAVEWKLIAGMRDRLSHAYDEVRHDVLWNTVHDDLPLLSSTIEQMLRELEAAAAPDG